MNSPSKSQVNRAGKVLRRWARGEVTTGSDERAARDVLLAFRAAHEVPLTKANMGLRSVVRTERCRVEVSQRLKRVPTIVDKLIREPTMQLANMQDIGGCRAVLDTIDEVRRAQKRLSKNRPPLRVADYIDSPRASGYRGVHVIVTYDGRPIEVQLRTQVMHDWAITVERLSGRMAEDLKSGRGRREILEWLEAISEAMALEESGLTVSPGLISRLARLREEAVTLIQRGQS